MTDAPTAPASVPLIDELRRELERLWPRDAEPVHEISRYALLPSGKLLRPRLLLHCAQAVGGRWGPLPAAALSVEYLHVGSLIHDDIIDGDQLRRGRPSVQARYGVPDAIVSGDALIFQSVSALVTHASPHASATAVTEAARVLAEAGADLCRGQAMEARLIGDVRCGLTAYRTMIAQKTGALFRAACEIGALLGGGSPARVRALNRFGHHLGLAFQMWDDLLGYLAPEELVGKPGASDVANRRPTLPVLLGYEAAGAADRQRLALALSGTLPEADAHRLMADVLDDTGALPLAERAAAREVEVAKSHLADLPESGGAVALAGLADAAIGRRN